MIACKLVILQSATPVIVDLTTIIGEGVGKADYSTMESFGSCSWP